MSNETRPELSERLSTNDFLNFYYLKEELQAFCKKVGLKNHGSKADLNLRISRFLGGEAITLINRDVSKPQKKTALLHITPESLIPNNFKCSQVARAFFKAQIGNHFHFYTEFMDYLKENPGKSFSDAVEKWKKIHEKKQSGEKGKIAPQFEYNRYIRAFHAAHPEMNHSKAVKCWRHKKGLPGHNRFEESDLKILKA